MTDRRWSTLSVTSTSSEPDRQSVGSTEALAFGSIVVALLVTSISAVVRGWVPISDEALMELLVRDVPSHLPLVGVYSRFGWSHPGPFQFYYLAFFYRLGGQASSMLLVGTVVLHGLFAAVVWWAARRIDCVTAMLVLVGIAAVMATTPGSDLRTPWNPLVVTIGGAALLVTAWSFVQRHRFGSILVLPVASVLVQVHVVNAPMVLVVLVVTVAPVLVGRRDDLEPIRWRWIALGAAIAMVLWIPPVVQQLFGDNGNLWAILTSGGGEGERVGLRNAVAALTHAFAPVPYVLDPGALQAPLVPTGIAVPIWLVVPVAGFARAVRRRDRQFSSGLVLCGAGLVGGVISMAMLTGGFFDYLVIMLRPLTVTTLVLGAAALLTGRGPRIDRLVTMSSCIVTVLLAVVAGIVQIGVQNPLQNYEPTVRSLTSAIEANTTSRTISVRSTIAFRSAELKTAIMLQLERDGYDVWTPDTPSSGAGVHRTRPRPGFDTIIAPLANEDELVEEGWTILGRHEVIDHDTRRRIEDLEREAQEVTERMDRTAPNSRERRRGVDELTVIWDRIDRLEAGRIEQLVAGRESDGS